MQYEYRTQTDINLHYDPVTITLHWITVVLIGLLWVIGQTIDFAPNGPLRVDYRSLHIVLGSMLAGVFIARFTWRMTRGRVLPPVGNVWLASIAVLVHWGLYALIAVALVLGLTNVWVRGDMIFNLFQVPPLDPSNQGLRHMIGGWHALAANAILLVAGLHAAAALLHHYILRDGVLRRMLPMA
jgi:cytochrome b561